MMRSKNNNYVIFIKIKVLERRELVLFRKRDMLFFKLKRGKFQNYWIFLGVYISGLYMVIQIWDVILQGNVIKLKDWVFEKF